MKELKSNYNHPILNEHYPLAKENRFTKRWVIAASRGNWKQQRLINEALEIAYHSIIDTVKRLYLTDGEIYYDRDYKHDKMENCLAMHSFITSTFYIYLECDFCYDYKMEYDFHNCPFEAEVLEMLKQFPMNHAAKRIHLVPDYTAFYEKVLQIQDSKFIYSFKRVQC